MSVNVEDIRKEYALRALSEQNVPKNPLDLFEQWLKEALEAGCLEATAMHLATVGADGRPSGRIVLLKAYDASGFSFYTNYTSHKGTDLAANPSVALTFFWPELERQIRIEGRAGKVDRAVSEEYFHSRPRLSQLGAHASHQSRRIASRQVLEDAFKAMEAQYPAEVPLPEHWGGYLVTPTLIEFWQGRRSRLHDRIQFEALGNGAWSTARLAP